MNRKLTLDYGVRLVHQTPQYDARGQASNFFADKWNRVGGADALRRRLRQRRVSLHRHEPPGDESADRPVPRTEHARSRSARSCPTPATRPTAWSRRARASRSATYLQPALGVGAALRHGLRPDRHGSRSSCAAAAGSIFDRPSGNAVFAQVLNPPARRSSRCATGSCRRSAPAAWRPRRRRR